MSPDGFINQAGTIHALGMSQPDSMDEMHKVGNNMLQPTGTIEAGGTLRAQCAARLFGNVGCESRAADDGDDRNDPRH